MTQRGGNAEMMNDVRYLLIIWGRWASGGSVRSIGYPTEAHFINADTGGKGFTEGENEEAERIEKAMCQLKNLSRKAYDALVCEYVYKMTNPQAAEKLKCSKATYQWRRGDGEYFIAGVFFSNKYRQPQRKCLTG